MTGDTSQSSSSPRKMRRTVRPAFSQGSFHSSLLEENRGHRCDHASGLQLAFSNVGQRFRSKSRAVWSRLVEFWTLRKLRASIHSGDFPCDRRPVELLSHFAGPSKITRLAARPSVVRAALNPRIVPARQYFRFLITTSGGGNITSGSRSHRQRQAGETPPTIARTRALFNSASSSIGELGRVVRDGCSWRRDISNSFSCLPEVD
jgi:hypothetical protein